MPIVIPSIASGDPLRLGEELARVAAIGRLHLDIEDGNFVGNITFGKKTIEAISGEFGGELDAHLMTTNPMEHLAWLAAARVKAVCAHIEALAYPMQFLSAARKLGMRAGLALNLKVCPGELRSYADAVDYALVMTSEPDGGDQLFFPRAVERVRQVRELLPAGTRVWCDGGITPDKLGELCEAGMEVAIMGRAVFGAEDPVAVALECEKPARGGSTHA